ncbi:MAG: hypothetical protein IPI83_07730 [Sphingomonadales bacterium]|nr:hypothetical protein [Sphingomonadales bacterium]
MQGEKARLKASLHSQNQPVLIDRTHWLNEGRNHEGQELCTVPREEQHIGKVDRLRQREEQ